MPVNCRTRRRRVRGRPDEYPRVPGQGGAEGIRRAGVARRCRCSRPPRRRRAAKTLGGPLWVVKSQIHAGGRGKGKFKEASAGDKGGVRLAKSVEEVSELRPADAGRDAGDGADRPAGKQVNRLYVEEGSDIAKEFYLSVLVDRETSRIAFVVSTEGGVNIEEVAHETPEKIVTFSVDPATGIMGHHGRTVAKALGLAGDLAKQAEKLVTKLYTAFVAKDMAMLEVNPLIVTKQGKLCARRQGVVRRQCALPPSGHRRAARRDRRRRQGNRGLQIRSQLRRARRHDRLHGQRRRPRDGDDGHHQALWHGAGELPRCRRRRDQGEGHRGIQDHLLRSECEGHPRQHLRRHHEMRHHRRRRGRGGEGSRAEGAAGGAARRHQCRTRQEDHYASPG